MFPWILMLSTHVSKARKKEDSGWGAGAMLLLLPCCVRVSVTERGTRCRGATAINASNAIRKERKRVEWGRETCQILEVVDSTEKVPLTIQKCPPSFPPSLRRRTHEATPPSSILLSNLYYSTTLFLYCGEIHFQHDVKLHVACSHCILELVFERYVAWNK